MYEVDPCWDLYKENEHCWAYAKFRNLNIFTYMFSMDPMKGFISSLRVHL